MTEKLKNDIFYVCTLIEYTARKTKNRRCDVVKMIGKEEIARQLRAAEVNHCLSLAQVSDELAEDFHIPDGNFDTVSECRYEVPSVHSIGKVYQRLVLATGNNDAAQAIMNVFASFISDEISDFNTNVYYSNPDYLRCCYEEGRLLA